MFKLQLPAHIQLKEKETSDCSDLLSSVCVQIEMSHRAELLAASESGESEVKDVIKAEKFRGRFLNLMTACHALQPEICLKLNPLEISSNSLYLLLWCQEQIEL